MEKAAERIMNKRGRRPKEVQEALPEATNDNDSEEDQPIARRRRSFKVVQAPPAPPVIKIEAEDPIEAETETKLDLNDQATEAEISDNKNDVGDPEVTFNGHENGHDSSLEAKQDEPITDESLEEVSEDKSETEQLADSLVEDEEEDTRSEVSADEESLPSTFNLGNLAWARVGSAPYWPCLITNDPSASKEKFTHVKLHKKILRREYHVHFFGK